MNGRWFEVTMGQPRTTKPCGFLLFGARTIASILRIAWEYIQFLVKLRPSIMISKDKESCTEEYRTTVLSQEVFDEKTQLSPESPRSHKMYVNKSARQADERSQTILE